MSQTFALRTAAAFPAVGDALDDADDGVTGGDEPPGAGAELVVPPADAVLLGGVEPPLQPVIVSRVAATDAVRASSRFGIGLDIVRPRFTGPSVTAVSLGGRSGSHALQGAG
jgi:hypothetical protein